MPLTGTEFTPKIRIVFHNEGLLRRNDLDGLEFLFGKILLLNLFIQTELLSLHRCIRSDFF